MSRRSIITATIALLAASAAVLVAFDDASARSFRGGAGMSRAGMSRGASMGSRSMGARSMGARNVGQRTMGRSAFSSRGSRMAMPQRSAGAGRMPSTSRLGRNALGSRGNGQALSRGGLGRSASSQFGRGQLGGRPNGLGSRQAGLGSRQDGLGSRSNGLGSRQTGLGSRQTNTGRFDPRPTGLSSRQAANQPANGRSLPRADLSKFDRSRDSARAGNTQMASNNQTGRRYENMNGNPMPGNQQANNNPQNNPPQSSNPPKSNNPPTSSNTPKDRGNRNPDPMVQIAIDWRNNFVRGVGGGLVPSRAGTAFSICQNLAWCAAGAPPTLGTWLMAPAPGVASNFFGGFVDSFTPTDPNDPLSTPFDNSVRNAVKGAQSYDLNPFNNIAPPAAWGQ